MLDHDLVLKSDELYLVGEGNTDGSGERASGLYVRDTRYLDRFDVRLNGVPLNRLSARALGSAAAVVVGANGVFPVPGGEAEETVRPLTVAVEQHVTLGTDLTVRFVLRNFAGRTLPLTLSLELGADFRDLFDVRGLPRAARGGTHLPPAVMADGFAFTYLDRAGGSAMTVVGFDRPATLAVASPPPVDDEPAVLLPGYDAVAPHPPLPPHPVAKAYFATTLAHGEEWGLTATLSPVPAGGVPISAEATFPDDPAPPPAVVATDDPVVDRILDRAAADLAMLQTSFPEGSLPAAGIPWYVAPFGRDSLIVGLQTLHLAPRRAAATLRVLAAHQGDRVDPFRDEEPGKILHEVRYGEMARLREIPHTPYYGTVDATPLFVLLFAETVAWTGDDRLYADLLPNVRRALAWIEQWGDADADGLVEYRTRVADGTHIVHQGWKDSHDSLHHADGRPVTGSVALVEVQGYVHAAYRRLAEVVALRGDDAWAAELGGRAEAMRAAVEAKFWLPDEGYYAQALDGDKAPVRSVSSNPGHLLFCGLPSRERAAAVAARLRAPDLDSGWGVRTLSAAMPTYNPMSYHNGSVWPHDNSLIAAGLAAYGFADDANRIAAALVAAAETDPLTRLPELFCGFARADETAVTAPVPYPVSCSPQAWAAAASQLLVRAMLGLNVDARRGRLVVRPALPDWLGAVTIRGLEVFGQPTALTVRRAGGSYAIETDGPVPLAAPSGRAA